MKRGLVEIVCIIDRSGSMSVLVNDAIGGFNSFLADQKKQPGEAYLTFIQFDNEYEVVHENKPIKDVPALTADTYRPRGSTALLDAIGKTIDDVGRRLTNTPDDKKPEKVIVVILTDGEENASHIFKRGEIKEKIKHQEEKYSWTFLYLGANQDAFAEASSMGICACNTATYPTTSKGITDVYGTISCSVTNLRSF